MIRVLIPILAPLTLLAMISPAFAGPPGENYQQVWGDEFNGDKLNINHWRHQSLGPRRKAVNVRDAVKLNGDGQLTITTRTENNQYTTGMVSTKDKVHFRYGYLEARMKFQKEMGLWSAFWLLSTSFNDKPHDEPAKNGAEIDIIEYLRKDSEQVKHALHWGGYGEHLQSNGHTKAMPGLGTGFHTVGLEWSPDRYTFYVDGQKTWTTQRAVSQHPQYIILSCEVGDWAGQIKDADLPDRFSIDYIRLYQDPDDKHHQLDMNKSNESDD